ncbi:MAG: SUMF1/EgtB/PvdO family nonheme iron enzyme, partial [Verrucomicrobiota bacterium]|nr:SUMF1/EgtB/PvdO family nonheme iron enzyme [Verrucomicrobiota bacterium]
MAGPDESSRSDESVWPPASTAESLPDVPTEIEPIATPGDTNTAQETTSEPAGASASWQDLPTWSKAGDAEPRQNRELHEPLAGLLRRPPLRQERLREKRRRAILAGCAALLIAGALAAVLFSSFSPFRSRAPQNHDAARTEPAAQPAIPEQPAVVPPSPNEPASPPAIQGRTENEQPPPASLSAPVAATAPGAEGTSLRQEPAVQPPPAVPSPAPTGAAQPGRRGERWVNSLGMEFVPVGDAAGGPAPDLLFCVWETRVKDYEAYCAAVGRTRQRALYEASDTHPVAKVTWNEAKAFCEWLTNKELNEGILTAGETYRLPTDLEWSIAAGLPLESGKTPEARDGQIKNQFPWGTKWPPTKGAGNFADASAKRERSSVIDGYKDGFA